MNDDILSQLGPEGLQALMQIWELEQQDSDLQGQIQQANALRMQQGPERYGGLAAGIQGAADMLRAYKGKKQEQALRQERQDLLGKITAGKMGLAGALYPPQPAGAEDEGFVNLPDYLRRS